MGNYLPLLLLILVCPLMMFFMMRGLHGGHDRGAGHDEPRQGEQSARADVGSEQRIRDLEHEVAELRADRHRTEGNARPR